MKALKKYHIRSNRQDTNPPQADQDKRNSASKEGNWKASRGSKAI